MFAQLLNLFETDEKLKRTVPTQTYSLDQEKVKLFNQLQDFGDPMEIVKVDFRDWQEAFAKMVDLVLDELKNGVEFTISTGITKELQQQSASGPWTFYIIRKLLESNGVQFYTIDESWNVACMNTDKHYCEKILFVDDFMNSGIQMSKRICSAKLPNSAETRILIAVALIPNYCRWWEPLSDFEKEYKVSIQDRVDTFVGRVIEMPLSARLLFDHKSLEELHDDLHAGYVGSKGFIGSLVAGANIYTEYQYPPALYHLEFGSGKLPKTSNQLYPQDIYVPTQTDLKAKYATVMH